MQLLTFQDIKMGSCVFQCVIPFGQPHVCRLRRMGSHVLCLWHGIPVRQHIGQSINATDRHCCIMTLDVKTILNPNISRLSMPYHTTP